jgi:hypothetical protein
MGGSEGRGAAGCRARRSRERPMETIWKQAALGWAAAAVRCAACERTKPGLRAELAESSSPTRSARHRRLWSDPMTQLRAHASLDARCSLPFADRLRRRAGREPPTSWCDASGAFAGDAPVVLRRLWSADLELIDDGRVAGWLACVVVCTSGRARGQHSRRSRNVPSPSAEATGAVKCSPSGPRPKASREAGHLTDAGWRSY